MVTHQGGFLSRAQCSSVPIPITLVCFSLLEATTLQTIFSVKLCSVYRRSAVKDVFGAGTDTTLSTLEWCMTELMKSTETMVKAKAEISQVLGQGKMLEEADIHQLPYLRCIVKETLRLHPPLLLLLPCQINEEAKVIGYIIPKNSQVNAWAVGRDPVSWINPLSFYPERFLDSEIDVKGQDFELIPFGTGRRICPGLPLVMRMVPAMFGSLLNCFNWELEGGIAPNELDMVENFGITVEKLYPLRALATSVSGLVI